MGSLRLAFVSKLCVAVGLEYSPLERSAAPIAVKMAAMATSAVSMMLFSF